MPRRRPGWVPKLTHIKAPGRGRARIPGKGDVYFGAAGDWPAGRRQPPRAILDAYRKEVAAWLAAQADGGAAPEAAPGCTVTRLTVAYAKHCDRYYRKRGRPSSEAKQLQRACGLLRKVAGAKRAAEFRAADLRDYREHLLQLKTLNRRTINAHVGRIRRMFRWAASRELVSEDVWLRLRAVEGLRRGRSPAREPGRVLPADPAAVAATLPHLAAHVGAMVRLQLLSGMRPEEVCGMRAHEVEDRGDVWAYRVSPDWDKTAHHEGHRPRVVYLGPQAQAVLRPWLDAARERGAEAPVFIQSKGGPMLSNHYGDCIREACDDNGIARWSPGQLRHNRGTDTRARFGLEAAQAELGHSNAEVTLVYALRDEELAKKVARESG